MQHWQCRRPCVRCGTWFNEAHQNIAVTPRRRPERLAQDDGTDSTKTHPTIAHDDCLFAYFLQLRHNTTFPGVVELARRVLPCPLSTAPIERIFSVAGQVERGAKYDMTDATLAMQTTLCEVWDVI
jgi:hypothetical protein